MREVMREVMKWTLALLFVAAGVLHFWMPDFYVRIMPPYLPWHLELVYLSGIAEIVLGILLLIPRFQRLAAWGLILLALTMLLIAVFPANLHMALHAELYPRLPPILLWLRLPMQGLLILWAFWFTRSKT